MEDAGSIPVGGAVSVAYTYKSGPFELLYDSAMCCFDEKTGKSFVGSAFVLKAGDQQIALEDRRYFDDERAKMGGVSDTIAHFVDLLEQVARDHWGTKKWEELRAARRANGLED